MPKKTLQDKLDELFDGLELPSDQEIIAETKSVKIAKANSVVKKGIKLQFSEAGKLAHAENNRKTALKRKYNHTIYEGTCMETGKKIKLDIHGLREQGFIPANVSRVVNGHKNSHRGYTWKIIKKELK
jgi:G:T/U-mismatch repair DNA glycosylase